MPGYLNGKVSFCDVKMIAYYNTNKTSNAEIADIRGTVITGGDVSTAVEPICPAP